MKTPAPLYAPVARRTSASRWLGRLGALLAALAIGGGALFAFLEFRGGRGGAWATIQAWFGAPAPADPAVNAFRPVTPVAPETSPAERLRHFRDETVRQPANPRAWAALAVEAVSIGENEEAIRARLRVIQLQPLVQDSWIALALLYARLNRWPEAEKTARRAASLDGSDSTTAWVLFSGAAAITREKPENARRVASMASLVADDPARYVALAREITRLGHTDISIPMLEHAILGAFPGAKEALIEAYEKAGRKEDADRARGQIMKR